MLSDPDGESTVPLVDKLKALKVNDWLVVAGGVLVLVFGLFRWFSWEVDNEASGPRARATPSTTS